jgi:hypothetical protein
LELTSLGISRSAPASNKHFTVSVEFSPNEKFEKERKRKGAPPPPKKKKKKLAGNQPALGTERDLMVKKKLLRVWLWFFKTMDVVINKSKKELKMK